MYAAHTTELAKTDANATTLEKLQEGKSSIDTSGIHPALKETHFVVACDVTNPFYGPDGAAYIFAQQKGTDPKMVQRLDEGMQSLAEVGIKEQMNTITNRYNKWLYLFHISSC